MDQTATEVVVAGGGIGGLASALALTRAGAEVRVVEQAPEFGEVGAGLQLAPNATRLLRSWGLLDEVIAAGVLPERLVMRDALDGSELTSLDLSDVAERYGAPYLVVHRSDLHRILVDGCRAAGVELSTDTTVERVESDAEGAYAFTTAGAMRAGLVVAADGLSSRLRAAVSSDAPVDSGYVAHRGTLALSDHPAPESLAMRDVTVFVGPGRHFVQYALRGGTMLNQVAVHQAQRPGRAEPVGLDEGFAGSCKELMIGVEHLWRDRNWPMFDRLPIQRWVQGRMVLTGDAAHPMLQYLAQGACQALEDAAALASSWSAAGDLKARLQQFNETRAPRTAQVQERARFWGEFWHLDGAEREARNAMLRERKVHDYQWVDWLYR